jgi:heptosyltransferase II
MKFLIVQTAFIGDVVLATALVEKLHRFYPDARIDFLLRKGNETLLNEHPKIGKTWIWDKKIDKYRHLFQLIRDIRHEKYDAVINCQRFAASGLLTVLSGAKQTIGFDKNPFSLFFSKKMPHRIGAGASRFGLPYWHELDRNLSLIDHFTDTAPERPRLYPTDADETTVAPLTQVGKYVCMAPTSVWFTKRWPEEKWAELIQRMPNDHTIYLLGAPNDAAACQRIAAASGHTNVVNLAGKTSLTASALLMRGARMNYVNDSAPLHIATAVNAPVTAIFCSTVPEFGFTPISDQAVVVQSPPLPCRPCGLHGRAACPKGHFKCSEAHVYFEF